MFGSPRLLRFSWPSAESLAQRAGDAGIAACLFVAPLWFGGRHDLGRLLYVVAVALAVVGVFSHAALSGKKLRVPRSVLCLMAAALGLLTLQTLPLPDVLYQWLAPDLSATLPIWSNSAWGVEWRTLSFSPAETREGLALLTTHMLLFLAVAIRIQSLSDLRRLLSWIAYMAIGMAILAFVQYAASNGKLLWVYRHPHVEMGKFISGTFSTKNHFAHLMALGLGPVCWLAFGSLANGNAKRRRSATASSYWLRVLAMASVALLVVATLAAQSRGGAAALVVAAVVIGAGYLRSGAFRLAQVAGLIGVVLVAIGGVSLFGYEQISGRLDDLVSGDVETLDTQGSRRAIWAANAEAWQASPLIGFGVGTHRDVYPLFMDEPVAKEFTHAESGYMQIASETGSIGLVLLVLAIGLCGWWLLQGFRDSDPDKLRLWTAIAPGLVASLVHSVVDFVWFIPSLFAVTMVLAACAMRLVQLHSEEAVAVSHRHKHATQPLAAYWGTGMVTMLAALAVGTLFNPAQGSLEWDRYLRCSNGLRGMARQLAGDPAGADPHLAETIVQNTIYSGELLRNVVQADPGNARAHLRLAGRLLQQFELGANDSENSMAIELIRGAAINGGFGSHREMLDWLARAFGKRAMLLRLAHAHARRAVELAPLQGEGYLYLATLSFLDPSEINASQFVAQAIAVRPYKGSILFEAGRQQQLAGNETEAIDLWQRSIRRPGSHQYKLVTLLAGRVPARVFLESLDPGPTVLTYAMRQYNLVGNDADRLALAQHARKEALRAEAEGENPLRLAYRWRQVSSTLRSLQENGQAIEAAEKALLLAPHVFTMRLELAHGLRAAGRLEEADPHIRWCLARRPDIRYLHVWLADSAKRRTAVDQNRRQRKRLFATQSETPSNQETASNEPKGRSAVRPPITPTSSR